YKQIVCYSNVCGPFSNILDLQKNAIGVRVDSPHNCPAFCYRITVTNAGTVALSNLLIVDNSVPGPDLNIGNCSFPTALPAGAAANCVIPAFTRCGNDVNVVTATAMGLVAVGSSQAVSARDTNYVTVMPISIDCRAQVLTNGVVATPPSSG